MRVKNHRILMPAVAVAVLVFGVGYYGVQLTNKQNIFSKALAYTSAVNPVDQVPRQIVMRLNLRIIILSVH